MGERGGRTVSFDLTLFTSTFVTLLVILDPPGAIPIFLALTGPLSAQQKAAAARRASLVALAQFSQDWSLRIDTAPLLILIALISSHRSSFLPAYSFCWSIASFPVDHEVVLARFEHVGLFV